jgi:DNA gyrase subunit A
MDSDIVDDARPVQPTTNITAEMTQSFLDYGLSVVTARAVPDVRDGLKPVHRRIIYGMEEGGFHANKQRNKSAKIVGDVMGHYHPHGDASIYDSLVRMAQPFVMRAPLVDGQGNFGSIDGDKPAAMRYTESRMAKLAHELTRDIDMDTVDFQPNYDGRELEPKVLPARFPNVLINGQTGIAVGMATNIPPHNLGEVMDGLLRLLDKPDMTLDEMMVIIPGPDFPTRGVIHGKGGIRNAYTTGRGSIPMSGVFNIEEMKGNRQRIVITELPFLVNKEQLIVGMAAMVQESAETKRLQGIADIRDESTTYDDIRIVIDIKRDADANIVLNQLIKHTNIAMKWHYNATCLNSQGKPCEMPLLDILSEFVAFRKQVVERRTIFQLNKARDELHKQVALYAATSRIDEVVRTIRSSQDGDEAVSKLMALDFPTAGDFAQLLREADPDTEPGENFRLDSNQADAILKLALRTLTGLEREKIADHAREISSTIRTFIEILNDSEVLNAVVRRELQEIKDKYAEPRLTRIEASELDEILDDELIERKDIVVNITAKGYIKRTDVSGFREQKRGGQGKTGMETKEDDYVVSSFVCTTKTNLVFFTTRGMGYAMKAWHLPDAPPNHRGRALVNFMSLQPDETISAVVALPDDKTELEAKNLVFVTNFGTIRRNAATDFANINKNGKIAIQIADEKGRPPGKLMAVLLTDAGDDILLATSAGMGIRFPISELRVFAGRTSEGVRAIDLPDGATVISASLLKHFDATVQERDMFFNGGSMKETDPVTGEPTGKILTMPTERLVEMQNSEQMVLMMHLNGHGKKVSSHEYRTTHRGGKGFSVIPTEPGIPEKVGPLVACFAVEETDSLILVTDGGQTIRTPVADINRMRRKAGGVRVFKAPGGQKLVSVARLTVTETPEEEAPPAQ